MVELQLEAEAEALLERFAAQSGLTKAEFARKAVLDSLEDREDYEAGVAALKEAVGHPTFSLEEVVHSLALESVFPRQSTETVGEPGCRGTKADSEIRERKTSRIA